MHHYALPDNFFNGLLCLSRAELVAEIESAFGLLLSRLRQQEVMVFLQDGMRLELIAYGKRNGLPVQQVFELPALLSRKNCSVFLEERLALAAVVKQAGFTKATPEVWYGARSYAILQAAIF